MKRLILAALFLSLSLMCPVVAEADYIEDTLSDYKEILPQGEATSDADEILEEVGIKAFIQDIINAIQGQRNEITDFFLTLLGVTVITSLSVSLFTGSVTGELSAAMESALSAIGAVLIFERLRALVGGVSAALSELSAFFGALIPIMTGLTASGGGGGTAAAQAAGMSLSLGAINMLSSNLLLPMVSVIFALALVGALSGDGAVSALAGSVKSMFMWTVGILSTVLIASLSLQTVITGATDSMAMRTAKYAAAGMIPIVGGTVSSTLATLASGISYAKSVVGVGAISAIVGICIAPLVRLILCRFSFEICIALSGFFSKSPTKYLSAMRSALDALMAVFSLSCVIYITEIVLFMRCGVALL